MVEITDDRSCWPTMDTPTWQNRKRVVIDARSRKICFFSILLREGRTISQISMEEEENVFGEIPECVKHLSEKYNLQEPISIGTAWQGTPVGEIK